MQRFIYAAWFRDDQLEPSDQDREWVACFVIESEAVADAHEWGDHLAKAMCARKIRVTFLRSDFRMSNDPMYSDTDLADIPTVRDGEIASDERIGW